MTKNNTDSSEGKHFRGVQRRIRRVLSKMGIRADVIEEIIQVIFLQFNNMVCRACGNHLLGTCEDCLSKPARQCLGKKGNRGKDYLDQTIRHKAFDAQRRSHSNREIVASDGDHVPALDSYSGNEANCSEKIEEAELIKMVEVALESLSPIDRAVTISIAKLGMTIREVAKQQGISVGSVHARWHRARAKLKTAIQSFETGHIHKDGTARPRGPPSFDK